MARSKKGYMLALVLVIMVMGVVIIGALSHYLGASLLLATRSEERAINFYAADSGFEDACFWVQKYMSLPGWNSSGEDQWKREPYVVNGRTVNVNVTQVDDDVYKVTSSASINDTVSTVIESYIGVTTLNLSPMGDNAITSDSDVEVIGGKGGVIGQVEYAGSLRCPGDPDCDDSIDGPINYYPGGISYWPSTQDLKDYFFSMVNDLEHFPVDTIWVNENPIIGSLMRDGNLEIKSEGDGVVASLNGTVYVKGDLFLGHDKKDFTLELNNNFIFCEGAIFAKDKCAIRGTGGIIAIGDLFFGPKSSSGDDEFLFLMSSEGEVQVNPNSDFYGSIAGDTVVELFPGVELIWTDPAEHEPGMLLLTCSPALRSYGLTRKRPVSNFPLFKYHGTAPMRLLKSSPAKLPFSFIIASSDSGDAIPPPNFFLGCSQ